MRFLLDAQLPKKLSYILNYRGYDTLHTLDLPRQNLSKDSELNTISVNEKRVLISKDMDFVESLTVSGKPYKLLYINTGNIHNRDLQTLFVNNIEKIVLLFDESRFIELTDDQVIVHW